MLGVLIGLAINQLDRHYHLWKKPEMPSGEVAVSTANDTDFNKTALPLQSRFMPTLDHRLNILVLGVDSNGRGTQRFLNTRSDTMLVASVDPVERKVSLVSVPRDSRVTIPGGHGDDKINSAHAFGGPDLAIETVRQNFGVPIDRYLVVDTQGIKKIFEVIGPVEVLVEKRMVYADHTAGLNIDLKPGLQTLSPTELEQYVRFRHDAKGDISRIERQQWFLRQLANKFQDPATLMKLPELYQCVSEAVQTNLTLEEMAELAAFAKDLKATQIETAMVPGKATMINGGSYWLPDFDATAVVFNRLCGADLIIPFRKPLSDPERFGDDDLQGPFAARAAEVGVPRSAAPIDSPEMATVDKPLAFLVRYAKGSEPNAKNLECILTKMGYSVLGRVRADLSDCQHDQIIQSSIKPSAKDLSKLREQIPAIAAFPTVINLDTEASTDVVIVLSPNTHFPDSSLEKSQLNSTDGE
jgi:LCP family protein required for cell wall assembly